MVEGAIVRAGDEMAGLDAVANILLAERGALTRALRSIA